MKWVLIGIVLFTLPLVVRCTNSSSASFGVGLDDVRHHDRRGLPVLLGVRVHGGPRGLVQQPGVRHHDCHHPVRGASCCSRFLGKDSSIGPVAAVMIGAVVCCAACVAGDNLQDLKAGYIVGATPWRQQVMLAIGSISCALVMAPMLNLLATATASVCATAEHPQSAATPRRPTLMASVARGMFGGQLPWGMIAIGAAIGIAVIVLDEILRMRGSTFRMPVLAVAVGIYLPLETHGADLPGRPAQPRGATPARRVE